MEEENIFPMSRVDPADTRMELACVCAKTILLYLEDKYGPDAVRRVVSQTGMNLEYLQGRTNWISLAYFYRLLDELVEFTGNPRAPFEAGTYAGRKESFGALALLFARSITVSAAYRFSVWLSPMWDKSAKWALLESRPQSCTVSLIKLPHQAKNNCLCVQGCLTAGPQLKGLPAAKVEELACACEGAPACIYKITWQDRTPHFWGSIGFGAGLAIGILHAFILGWQPAVYPTALLYAVLGFFIGRVKDCTAQLKEVYRQNEEQAESLLETLRTTETLNQELQTQVEHRTAELKASYEEQKQMLVQLRESQDKMMAAERQAAVGVLAAGTAHELNSPMNAITLSLQAFTEETKQDGQEHSLLETANRAASRCKRIVNDLLSFARDSRRTSNACIEDIVNASVSLFEREHARRIPVIKNIQAELPSLVLDQLQIQQAILNLLVNAADAIHDKPDGRIQISLSADRDHVVLSVADNGSGMDDTALKKVFEQFFSTKRESGRGLGLGLSITYQLVKRNDGEITVSSEEGHGTVFTIRFPILDNSEPEQKTGA